MKIIILYPRAPNTPSGNPNRVFVAIDTETSAVIGAWKADYSGRDAIPDWAKERQVGHDIWINVPASEAKAYLKQGQAVLREAGLE